MDRPPPRHLEKHRHRYRQAKQRSRLGCHPAPLPESTPTFAVRSLETCGNDLQSVLRHMRALSAYLGHVDIANTYWYLEATPVLLQMIAARAEETWIGGAA